jgi:hypothetical protein
MLIRILTLFFSELVEATSLEYLAKRWLVDLVCKKLELNCWWELQKLKVFCNLLLRV